MLLIDLLYGLTTMMMKMYSYSGILVVFGLTLATVSNAKPTKLISIPEDQFMSMFEMPTTPINDLDQKTRVYKNLDTSHLDKTDTFVSPKCRGCGKYHEECECCPECHKDICDDTCPTLCKKDNDKAEKKGVHSKKMIVGGVVLAAGCSVGMIYGGVKLGFDTLAKAFGEGVDGLPTHRIDFMYLAAGCSLMFLVALGFIYVGYCGPPAWLKCRCTGN